VSAANAFCASAAPAPAADAAPPALAEARPAPANRPSYAPADLTARPLYALDTPVLDEARRAEAPERSAPPPDVGRDLAAHVAKLRAVVGKTTARAARKKRPGSATSPYVPSLPRAKAKRALGARAWKDAAYDAGPEVFARLDRYL